MTCEPPPASVSLQRNALRRQLRQRRRALSRQAQQSASRRLDQALRSCPALRRAHHVAAYVASDGEIDPAPYLRWARRQGKAIWLPVVCDARPLHPLGLRFAPAPTGRRGWQRNRFGIPEPRSRHSLPPSRLDVLLMPLVGFDADGNRLGMGGGYYDRLLEHVRQRPRRPRCLGLAHRCQQVSRLDTCPWDQPVDAIVIA